MFVCKVCGSEVHQGEAFCLTCGADVVENYETICPVCSAKNVAGSRFCSKCGGMLSILRKPICPVCNSKNLPGAKFCVSCGAPLNIEAETHSEEDMLEMRKVKKRIDNMEKERMAAVDKEIASKRAKLNDVKENYIKEIEEYRKRSELEYQEKATNIEEYKKKIEELGSSDVALLKRISRALNALSRYYADPYSQIDEDDIEGDTFVCPVCGTINPLDATKCTHCGRSKARSLLLLAKGKIKQSPPVKRKQIIIEAPDFNIQHKDNPTLDEFVGTKDQPIKPVEEPKKEETKEAKQNPSQMNPQGNPYYGGYPYQQYQGTPQQYQGGPMPMGAPINPGYYIGPDGEPYQMPPIVQPVAFVPYVTQEQPLMQYTPKEETVVAKPIVKQQVVQDGKKGKKKKQSTQDVGSDI